MLELTFLLSLSLLHPSAFKTQTVYLTTETKSESEFRSLCLRDADVPAGLAGHSFSFSTAKYFLHAV